MGTTNKDTLSYILLTHFSLFIHFLQYINQSVWTLIVSRFWQGGDPTAGSPTVTLLRLHPSHESYRGKRPPEG